MKTDIRKKQVLDQQLALSAYLDALLEVPHDPSNESRSFVKETKAPAGEVTPEIESQSSVQTETEIETPPTVAQTAENPSGVPDWADGRFQVLLFEVAGLTLAVPLVKLKGVVPNDQGLTPIPGHSSLFLGITPYQGLQSKVVDTARFVLPQDRVKQLDEDASERCQHLVMIDDGRWALACNRIGDVVELEHDGVKWRSTHGTRLWLAGTVIEKMCALLDVEQLSRELVTGLE